MLRQNKMRTPHLSTKPQIWPWVSYQLAFNPICPRLGHIPETCPKKTDFMDMSFSCPRSRPKSFGNVEMEPSVGLSDLTGTLQFCNVSHDMATGKLPRFPREESSRGIHSAFTRRRTSDSSSKNRFSNGSRQPSEGAPFQESRQGVI
jgi:hypothetical protein